MPTTNPLFRNWNRKKFQATVVNDIWPEVLFFTLVATMVYLVSSRTNVSLAVSNQLLTVLGTVLGLVISFRTSSAYERYQEGRKLWTGILFASRNLAHMIWNHVPSERDDKDQKLPEDDDGSKKRSLTLAAVIEKKTMINLIQAFSVSTKHSLRGEPGIYYEDLYPLVCYLPRYSIHPPEEPRDEDMLPLWKASELGSHTLYPSTSSEKQPAPSGSTSPDPNPQADTLPRFNGAARAHRRKHDRFDPEQVLPKVPSEYPLKPARNPPSTGFFDYFPFFRFFKFALRSKAAPSDGRTVLGRKAPPPLIESNIPLEISLYLSSYLAWLLKKGLLQPAIATGISNGIAALQDAVTNLERIQSTPLPFAYQAHLRMSLWIYLLLLPFQVYSAYKVLTIPATAFAAFLLLGFLEIGQEIENPFNYDENDLDLDGFCLAIQRELQEITAHTAPSPESYIFSPYNQPFAPADRRTAEEMMSDVSHEYHGSETGMYSVRRTLLKSWRDVDEITRGGHQHYI